MYQRLHQTFTEHPGRFFISSALLLAVVDPIGLTVKSWIYGLPTWMRLVLASVLTILMIVGLLGLVVSGWRMHERRKITFDKRVQTAIMKRDGD